MIDKMCEKKIHNRYYNFKTILGKIEKGILLNFNFTAAEKQIYVKFADDLINVLSNFKNIYSPIDNVAVLLSKAEKILRSNALEEHIQNNADLINSFLNNDYTYSPYWVYRSGDCQGLL